MNSGHTGFGLIWSVCMLERGTLLLDIDRYDRLWRTGRALVRYPAIRKVARTWSVWQVEGHCTWPIQRSRPTTRKPGWPGEEATKLYRALFLGSCAWTIERSGTLTLPMVILFSDRCSKCRGIGAQVATSSRDTCRVSSAFGFRWNRSSIAEDRCRKIRLPVYVNTMTESRCR